MNEMSSPIEPADAPQLLGAASVDELFWLVKTIVRRSARSRTGATMLERKIMLLLEQIRHDYRCDLSVTEETVLSIAACRLVASLLGNVNSS